MLYITNKKWRLNLLQERSYFIQLWCSLTIVSHWMFVDTGPSSKCEPYILLSMNDTVHLPYKSAYNHSLSHICAFHAQLGQSYVHMSGQPMTLGESKISKVNPASGLCERHWVQSLICHQLRRSQYIRRYLIINFC